MADGVENVASAPQSTYIPSVSAPATSTLNDASFAVRSFKDKQAYLRDNKFWVGKAPRQDVVENLYSLHTSGNITADHWNMYGNAAKPWEEQSGRVKTIPSKVSDTSAAVPEESADPVENPVPPVPVPEDRSVTSGTGAVDDVNTGGAEHVVKKGDTLSGIAKDYDIDLEDLIELNRGTIRHRNMIYLGQVVKLPQQEVSVSPGTSSQEGSVDEESLNEESLNEEPPNYEPHTPEVPASKTIVSQVPISYAHLLPPEPEDDIVQEEPVSVGSYSVAPGEVPAADSARYSTRSVMPVSQDEMSNPYVMVDIGPDESSQGLYEVSLPPSEDQIIAQSLFNMGLGPLRDAVSFIKDAGERVLSTSKDLMARAQEQSSDFMSGLFRERFIYRIGKGDTLTGIAKKHDISPARLLWDNRDSIEGTRIKEGRLLTVNKGEMSPSERMQAEIYYSNAVRMDNMLVHPEMRRLAPELSKIFEDKGYMVEIYSDFRTFERQAELHKSNTWPAAPAGYSDHNWGLAVDIRLYKRTANGNFVRLAAKSIPAEMAKHPAMTRELREAGLVWGGAGDPMHFSVGTVNPDYGTMIARRREAISMIGAKEGQLTPDQQRIIMYYVRSYQNDPSLSPQDRIKLARNYGEE